MLHEQAIASVAQLQTRFAHFAAHSVPDDPLYRALAEAAARHPPWAALLSAAPVMQQFPMLWLAALQDRVLELVDRGDPPALAVYYASVGAPRAPDAALESCLGAFIDRERDCLVERIATRHTQTNEIGRCAALWPVLQSLSDATGQRCFALLDVGCSAGLNLGVDHWRYRYVDDATGLTIATSAPGRDPRAPEIASRILPGRRPTSSAAPEIVSRLGIDLQPVSVDDAAGVRWLRSCLWPHDGERRARFDAAVAIAREQRWPVAAVTDAAASVARWRAAVPDGVLPVVFNSWVLQYFDAPLLHDHVGRLLDEVAHHGVVWISAEAPTLSRQWWPGKPTSVADGLPSATAWTVARPDGRGGVEWRLAATSHAHGRWMLCEG